MPLSHLPPFLTTAFAALAHWLDRRSTARLPLLLCGILFARGRRTVTSWLRARRHQRRLPARLHHGLHCGREAGLIALGALHAVEPVLAAQRLVVAIDDTPTARYGPEVKGCGIHHNPTPGPAGDKFLYGHVWVTLAALAKHPDWGTLALPLQAQLYIRQADREAAPRPPPPLPHQTGTGRRAVAWLVPWVDRRFEERWVVADGAYAKRPFLRSAREHGFTVVSRLRKDAALWSVPKPAGGAWPRQAAHLRQAAVLLGQAGRTPAWLARGGVRAVWRDGDQDDQDLPGDVAARGWADPRGDREGGGRLVAVLQHRPGGDGGGDPGGDGGSGRRRADLQGRQGGLGCGTAAGAQRVQQRGLLPPEPMDVQLGGSVGVGPPRGGVGRPQRSPWDNKPRRPSHADKRKALQREVLQGEIDAALAGGPSKEESGRWRHACSTGPPSHRAGGKNGKLNLLRNCLLWVV